MRNTWPNKIHKSQTKIVKNRQTVTQQREIKAVRKLCWTSHIHIALKRIQRDLLSVDCWASSFVRFAFNTSFSATKVVTCVCRLASVLISWTIVDLTESSIHNTRNSVVAEKPRDAKPHWDWGHGWPPEISPSSICVTTPNFVFLL